MGREAFHKRVRRSYRGAILHPGLVPGEATDPGHTRRVRRGFAIAAEVPTGVCALPGNHRAPEEPPTRVRAFKTLADGKTPRTNGPAFYGRQRAQRVVSAVAAAY